MNALAGLLGSAGRPQIGRQHALDEGYLLAHRCDRLRDAPRRRAGVRRSRGCRRRAGRRLAHLEDPTCVYLAHRGIKAANVPIVREPSELDHAGHAAAAADRRPDHQPGVAGTSGARASACSAWSRATRQGSAATTRTSTASAASWCLARRLFARHKWPEIDVTKRSVEETAAAIYQMVQVRQQPELKALAADLPNAGWAGDSGVRPSLPGCTWSPRLPRAVIDGAGRLVRHRYGAGDGARGRDARELSGRPVAGPDRGCTSPG